MEKLRELKGKLNNQRKCELEPLCMSRYQELVTNLFWTPP